MTKPVLPAAWASDTLYTTGPRPSTPTKVSIPPATAAEGHRPGKDDPTGAQHMNDWLADVSTVLAWLANEQGTGFFGDGSDGADTIAVPTTLTSGKNYTNLTLDDVLNVDHHIVRVNGILTINSGGFLRANGGDGGDASASTGGAAGIVGTPSVLHGGGAGGVGGSGVGSGAAGTASGPAEGGAGGDGGTSGGGSGGTGGTATAPIASEGSVRALPQAALARIWGSAADSQRIEGGGGGGGGGSNDAGGGGGGGGGGGNVLVVCCRELVVVAGGAIQADGGDGGDAFGTEGSGGAPGGGGLAVVVYRGTNQVAIATMIADGRLSADAGVVGAPTGAGGAATAGVDGLVLALNA